LLQFVTICYIYKVYEGGGHVSGVKRRGFAAAAVAAASALAGCEAHVPNEPPLSWRSGAVGRVLFTRLDPREYDDMGFSDPPAVEYDADANRVVVTGRTYRGGSCSELGLTGTAYRDATLFLELDSEMTVPVALGGTGGMGTTPYRVEVAFAGERPRRVEVTYLAGDYTRTFATAISSGG
jgi:hypothetical protein